MRMRPQSFIFSIRKIIMRLKGNIWLAYSLNLTASSISQHIKTTPMSNSYFMVRRDALILIIDNVRHYDMKLIM